MDHIIISHNHHDHIGGLGSVLSDIEGIPVYVPDPPDPDLEAIINNSGAKVESSQKPQILTDHAWTSGTMGYEILEQCLVIQHEKGLLVIVGCSHPGIVDMLQRITREFNREIYAVVRGFHLMMDSNEKIDKKISEFREIGVQKCGCTHCTGDKQISQFRQAFGEQFIEMGTGRKIVF